MLKRAREILWRKHALIKAYQNIFDSPDGQMVLEHLVKNCHVLTPTFVEGDPYKTALHEGERRVVLSIMKMIGTDVFKIQQLMEQINVQE